MSFLSLPFFLFILILFAILRLMSSEQKRQRILLFASWTFYAYADYRFLVFLLLETIIAYASGRIIERKRTLPRVWTAICVAAALSMLVMFKYANFFIISFSSVLGLNNTGLIKLVLPLGMSFYTFQAISYIIDVYRKKVSAEHSFKRIALYIGVFPQITSGPIVKAYDFLPQLNEEHPIQLHNLEVGFQMFLLGMFKKVVIADRLGAAVDAVFSVPAAYSGVSLMAAAVTYSVQIYCDFSGYSDMAIGVASALGFRLGRNFNLPYLARNPSDFWKRWHISLSSWFKEYVYFPLGGSRKGISRTYLNLFIVMLLSGLWHGAGWTFVLWGAYHGLGSVIHHIYARNGSGCSASKVRAVLSCVGTYVFVTIGWVFFRAPSVESAFLILFRILTLAEGIHYISVYGVVFSILVFSAHVYAAKRVNGHVAYFRFDFSKVSGWFGLWLVVFVMLLFFYTGNNAFIYAQF